LVTAPELLSTIK